MFTFNTIGVFCGSAEGRGHGYGADVRDVGSRIARSGHKIVYGGGRVGLMGAIADGVLTAGGEIVGVMPQVLVAREIAHTGLTELILTQDMHERKAIMAKLSDVFVVLPGGTGTFEEFFEQWTWAQIGYHRKPIGLLNINGYFDPLLAMTDQMVRAGFLSRRHADMLIHAPRIDDLLEAFTVYQPPPEKAYDRHG